MKLQRNMTKRFLLFAACVVLTAACTRRTIDTNDAAAQETAAESVAEAANDDAPQYQDLALPGISGGTVKVSDYVGKNKLVLIDFWASWCAPCRAEMPAVVKTYTDFHEKGLEVVGVSFDNNHEAWVNAVGALNMAWPQMSDLRGWDSEGAHVYNITSIPANVLIDQEGRIVAKDLRGEDLYNTVAELLK